MNAYSKSIQNFLNCVAFIVLFFISLPLFAITPIDTIALPSQGWSGEVSLTLDGATGNNRSKDSALSFLVRHRYADDILLAIGDYNRGKVFDVKTVDNHSLHLRWIRLNTISVNLDQELFSQSSSDDFKDLRNRALIGYGARFRNLYAYNEAYASQNPSTLSSIIGLGGFYEQETRQSISEKIDKLRLNFYSQTVWEGSVDEKKLKAWGTLYLQPAFNAPSDIRTLLSAGVSLPIVNRLALSLNVAVSHDSKPFANIKRTNSDYQLKLTYVL